MKIHSKKIAIRSLSLVALAVFVVFLTGAENACEGGSVDQQDRQDRSESDETTYQGEVPEIDYITPTQPPRTVRTQMLEVASEVPEFGGMYYEGDDDQQRLVINLTDTNEEILEDARQAVVRFFGEELNVPEPEGALIPPEGVEAQPVEFTYAQLYEWYELLVEELWEMEGFIGSHIDERANRMEFDYEDPEAVDEQIQQLLDEYEIPPEALRTVEREPLEPETDQTLRDRVRMDDHPSSLVGGQQITRLIESDVEGALPRLTTCTLGLPVEYLASVDGAEPVKGFLTNSHCTAEFGEENLTVLYQTGPGQPDDEDRIGVEVVDPPFNHPGITEETIGGDQCGEDVDCRYSDAAFIWFSEDFSWSFDASEPFDWRGHIARSELDEFADRESAPEWDEDPTETLEVLGGRSDSRVHLGIVMPFHLLGGTTLKKTGQRTGTTEGEITSTCYDTNVSDKDHALFCQNRVEHDHYGRTENDDDKEISANGDSGSVWYAKTARMPPWRQGWINHVSPPGHDLDPERHVVLRGIHWGGNEDGTRAVYSPLSNIESELTGLGAFTVVDP